MKVEKETPIVHQNIKNIMNVTQTTHSAKNLFMWKKTHIFCDNPLAKRGLEPRTSRNTTEGMKVDQLLMLTGNNDIAGKHQ